MNYRQTNLLAGKLLLATALGVAFASGCKKADPIVGNWKDSKGHILAFKADNTFSQGTGKDSVGGKWTFEGKKLSIHVETIGGKSAEEFFSKTMAPMMTKMNPTMTPSDVAKVKASLMSPAFTLSDDGKTMLMDGTPAASSADATLTKEEAK